MREFQELWETGAVGENLSISAQPGDGTGNNGGNLVLNCAGGGTGTTGGSVRVLDPNGNELAVWGE